MSTASAEKSVDAIAFTQADNLVFSYNKSTHAEALIGWGVLASAGFFTISALEPQVCPGVHAVESKS
jgi:hypothetical protein